LPPGELMLTTVICALDAHRSETRHAGRLLDPYRRLVEARLADASQFAW
jgi:hypothetical protein